MFRFDTISVEKPNQTFDFDFSIKKNNYSIYLVTHYKKKLSEFVNLGQVKSLTDSYKLLVIITVNKGFSSCR